MTPQEILKIAHDNIASRGAVRDKGQERSMAKAVELFNTLYGHEVSETEGWCFMILLKLSRSAGGALNLDDYIDAASYAGLAGESAIKEWEAVCHIENLAKNEGQDEEPIQEKPQELKTEELQFFNIGRA